MNQVETMCDRVALLNKGRLMVYGTVDEVRRRYSHPEVLVHARRPLPAVAQAAATTAANGGWRVTLRDGDAPSVLLRALVDAGAEIDRFEPQLAPMEDIFLRVVKEGRS
jgi:ABC-2 type transport system ATP-binding protein